MAAIRRFSMAAAWTQFGGVFGQRFGATKKLGVLFGGTYDYNGRGIDNIQPALDPVSTFAQPFYDSNTTPRVSLLSARATASRGSTDYKFNDNNSIYAHGLLLRSARLGRQMVLLAGLQLADCPGGAAAANASTPSQEPLQRFYTSNKRPDASVGSIVHGRQARTAELLADVGNFGRALL